MLLLLNFPFSFVNFSSVVKRNQTAQLFSVIFDLVNILYIVLLNPLYHIGGESGKPNAFLLDSLLNRLYHRYQGCSFVRFKVILEAPLA